MPCRHGILEGDDIQQKFQEQSWITRSMAAIGQDNLIDYVTEFGIGILTQRFGTAKGEACVLQCHGLPENVGSCGGVHSQHPADEFFDKRVEWLLKGRR
jgi:hypothetical protein